MSNCVINLGPHWTPSHPPLIPTLNKQAHHLSDQQGWNILDVDRKLLHSRVLMRLSVRMVFLEINSQKRPCWVEKPKKLHEIKGKVRELRTRREEPGCTRSVSRGSQVQRAGVIRGLGKEVRVSTRHYWGQAGGRPGRVKSHQVLQITAKGGADPICDFRSLTSFKSIFSSTSQGTEISKNLTNALSIPVTCLHLSLVPGSPWDSLSDTRQMVQG